MAAGVSRSSIVLVVEDDRQTRELHRTALTQAGYSVVAVEDGIDALRYLDSHEPPAAVVLDFGLPRLHGRDLHREMLAHRVTESVPVIVVTGDDAVINEREFACVLRKPVDPGKLVAAVEDCLRSRMR
jgi:two-component system, NtrC family, phosphoglycerate transport system response regulator PgtA